MLPHVVTDPLMRERFALEAIVTADIESEHLVEVFAAGIDEETESPYIVMELLRGEDLGARLKRGERYTAEETILYLEQAARALEKTHERGVVHRDLKPENVLVVRLPDGSEVLKLLDFGIAKLCESAGLPRLTQKGCVFGTPVYMSPEQANGLDVDARADLYSLGVILYEMLSGRLPYRGDDLVELMHRQVKDPPDPMPTWVPARLRSIVGRLMAKNPDDRHASAALAHAALAEARFELSRTRTPVLAAAKRIATAVGSLPSLLGRRTKRSTVP